MTAQSLDSPTLRLPRRIIEQRERVAAIEAAARQADPAGQDEPEATPPAPPAIDPPAPTPDPTSGAASVDDPISLPPGDPRENDPRYWQQRARVIYGMLRQARLNAGQGDSQAQARIRELQEQLRTAKAEKPEAPTVNLDELFTPEQRQQYGDEQLQAIAVPLIQRAVTSARSAAAEELAPVREAQQASAEALKREAYQRFSDQLVALVPTAFEIDATPGWQEWLTLPDEQTGYTYHQMLKAHEGRHDAPRVAALFRKYLATIEAPLAPPAPPASPVPPVAPRGRGGPPNEPPAPAAPQRTPTNAEIREHYKQRKLGRVSDKDHAAFEARLPRS